MNKSEFNQKIIDINIEISKLNDLKKETEIKFIQENKKFEIGDKVKYHNKIGVVAEIGLRFGEDVGYKINKIRKDGNISTHSISHVFARYDELERV